MLGPLEVSTPNGPLDLGGRKQQAVVAVLLLNVNQVVPVDVLIEEIWGEESPLSAKTSLHAYVSRLRRSLDTRIETHTAGYLLRVDPLEVDRVSFERQADLAQEALAAGKAELALMRLREGLKLWRGRPLYGLPLGPASEVEVSQLEELHMTMLEQQVEALIPLGRDRDALAELEPLIAQAPYRERLRELLMITLYRSGRQADALAEYRATRELLVKELGIEPGPSLQDLQRKILAQDPALDVSGQVFDQRSARRQATVLLASFRSSDEPEALIRSGAEAKEILEHHGAVVLERPGEGPLAVFGVPCTREDDTLRSLRAAAELVDSVSGISNVAIESGEVLSEGERLIGGPPLTRVGGLSQEGREDDILLGEEAQSTARHYARMGPPTAEGARRLVDIDPGAEAIQRHFEGVLIGREVELSRLEQAFDAAAAQANCQLVTILGNPGIGKSKLAREFAERVSQRATVLEGRCPSFGEGLTFWPLAEMVRHFAGNLKRKTLQELLEDEPDAHLIARQLATALGTEEPADTAEDIFWALRELFGALARTRPLVLVFEDVHWAKPRLLDLLEQLVDFSQGAPILVICLTRLELLSERPAWGGGRKNSNAILLNPLSEAESRALARARSEAIANDQVEGVIERAEGNPLFIEQLLALLEEGGEPTQGSMPPSIQAVLAARLDLLTAEERAVIDHAAVIGLEFWVSAVAELMPKLAEELNELIAALVAKDFLRPARSELRGEEAYRFRHALLRDAAYLSVPKSSRAELHVRFVKWLDASAIDEGEREELAGHHIENAYRYRKEVEPDASELGDLATEAGLRFRRAGSTALLRSDAPSAIRLLEKALDLLPLDDPEHNSILVDIAPAYRAVGQWDSARSAVEKGLRSAQATEDEILEGRLRIIHLETEFQQGRLSVRDALEQGTAEVARLEKVGPHAYLDHGRIFIAWTSALLGQATEAEQVLRTLLGRHVLAPRVRLRALRLLPSQWVYGPLPVPTALERCRRSLSREELGLREIAAFHRCMALLAAMRGRTKEARELILEAIDKLSSLGLKVLSSAALLIHAEVETLGGDLDAAEELLRDGLDQLRRLNETLFAPELAAHLARVLIMQGKHDESWELIQEAGRSKTFDIAVPVMLEGTRAKLLALKGEEAQSAEAARSSIRIASRTDLLNLQADAYADSADAQATSGRQTDARRAWRKALQLYEQKGNLVSTEAVKDKLQLD